MLTLKEYLKRNPRPFAPSALLVCPAKEGFQKYIFTYSSMRFTLNEELCDIGSHPCWRSEFSEYTATWVPTSDVLVVLEG